MKTSEWRRAFAPASLLAAALLSGCVVVPARPYYPPDDEIVSVAPPLPREEVIGVAPAPGYLWLGGYWGWRGRNHVWIGGHWEAPRPGYFWRPYAWVPYRGGWRMNPGHWDRR